MNLTSPELDPKIYAHRALDVSSGIESPNSFEASGFYERGLECDVFLLSDGNFAVTHNKDIELGQEEVEQMSAEELTAYCLEQGYSNPPLLEEYLGIALDRGNPLLVELKASSVEQAVKAGAILGEQLVAAESALYDDAIRRGIDPDEATESISKLVRVLSFSIEGLHAYRQSYQKEDPEGRIPKVDLTWPSAPYRDDEMAISKPIYKRVTELLQTDDPETVKAEWIRAGAQTASNEGFDGFGSYFRAFTKEDVDYIHGLGLEVSVFGCNKDEQVAEMLGAVGVDIAMTESHV